MDRNFGRDSKTHHFKMPMFGKQTTQQIYPSLYEKHKQILSHYPSQPVPKQTPQSEASILQSNHLFIRDEAEPDTSWESRLAKRYYVRILHFILHQDKLFKEYGLVNLDRYKQNRIALRWRTEMEVLSGKGQFACGNIKCNVTALLSAWEVPFAYVEVEEKKVALVKLKLCQECAYKLNYKTIQEKRKRKASDGDFAEFRSDDKSLKLDEIAKYDDDAAKEDESQWSAPVKAQTEREEDEDFDAYLNDIFS